MDYPAIWPVTLPCMIHREYFRTITPVVVTVLDDNKRQCIQSNNYEPVKCIYCLA